MKRLILATAITGLVANTASAATVYEGKGLTYKLSGDWQIQLRQDVGADQDPDVEFDDLEIKNGITYDLGNGLTAIGQLDFGFKDAAEGKQSGSKLEEAYLGLGYGAATLTIGKRDFGSDLFGVEMAYELNQNEDRFDAQGTDGDDVVRLDLNLDYLTLIASTELEAEGEDSQDGQYYDLFISTDVAGLNLGAAYQNKEATPASDSEDTWGVRIAYDAGFATLAADYSSTDLNTHDIDQYNVAAAFDVTENTQIAAGMLNVDDESAVDDITEWYANVTYKFPAQKNVSVFAEVADTDEANVDLGYLAGLRVKF